MSDQYSQEAPDTTSANVNDKSTLGDQYSQKVPGTVSANVNDKSAADASPGADDDDDGLCTDKALKRALEACVLKPGMPTTTIEERNALYIESITDQGQRLKNELDKAQENFDSIDQVRDANTSRHQAPWLQGIWLKSNNELRRAERNFNQFVVDIEHLMDMPPLARSEMYAQVTARRNRAVAKNREADDIEDSLEEPKDQEDFDVAQLRMEVMDLRQANTDLSKNFEKAEKDTSRLERELDREKRDAIQKLVQVEQMSEMERLVASEESEILRYEVKVLSGRVAELSGTSTTTATAPCKWHEPGMCVSSSQEEQARGKFCRLLIR
ncbi:hypothetical protein LTR97_002057 [Elasticomyces elasticus]|uniref:Uncharacterized protein n=1 Tax=Elasticomyces elasticus TaxID=574655 RepID=A0AAN8A478_9PEZI|nr:hypothetical protein LTR97_002057 [Elasticomyces elasticus]